MDRAGSPLDLHRAFAVDDDVDDMRHFLGAGYLHVKEVFSGAEVDCFSAEVEHTRSNTVPGDPFSWWSVNADGDEVVTRINYLGRHSRVLQELSHEPRLLRFAGSRARTSASATTGSTDRWCSSSIPTS